MVTYLFLGLLFAIDFFSAIGGGFVWIGLLAKPSLEPAIVAMPLIIAAELAFFLGLILASVSYGAVAIIWAVENSRPADKA